MKSGNRIACCISARNFVACGLALGLLIGGGAMAQGGAAAQGSKPVRVRTQMDGFDLSAKSGKSANQIGGASRDLGTPKLYAPNLGKSFTTNPEFHWAAAEVGAKVTFKLMTQDGQTVYEMATTEDHLRYPGDAPALKVGDTYKWTIVPENDVLGGAPQAVGFTIVGGPEREAIQSELKAATGAMTTAEVFVKHRVWYDAVQEYSDVIARMPNDPAARAARGELYDQLSVTKSLGDADWRMVH